MFNNKNKRFKILVYGHIYVNISLLSKGIYETNIPHLYSSETTIELLIESYKNLEKNGYISSDIIKTSIENLSKCRLASVILDVFDN